MDMIPSKIDCREKVKEDLTHENHKLKRRILQEENENLPKVLCVQSRHIA